MIAATANRAARRRARAPILGLLALALGPVLPGLGPEEARGQDAELQARIWLDRSADAAYDRGDRARVYYQVSRSAYVAIFRIDTDGRIRLLHPRSPYDDYYTRGGRDHRLLFDGGRSPHWYVDDDPGLGYYFIIASPTPMDFSALDYASRGGWDLASVGRRVYRDPYVAIDDWVVRLVPDWKRTPYALDFAEYNVDRVHDYPRFLCYDCHGYRPYRAWNPYYDHCTSFRVVIYNDPYYYPVYRYRGTRVVFVRPPRPRQPRFVFKERAAGEPARPVVAARGSVKEADVPRRVSGKENGAAPVEIPRTAPGEAAPRRSDRGGAIDAPRRGDVDAPSGDRDRAGRVEAPRRSGSPSAGRAATPRATRDPVVVPRTRPSDRLRGRSGSSATGPPRGSSRPPDITRNAPPPVRLSPPDRGRSGAGIRPSTPPTTRSTPPGRSSTPRVRPSPPPTTRPSPPAKRSKPRVKKRGGGSVASGVPSPTRSRPSASRRSRSSSSGSILGRALGRILSGGGSAAVRRSPARGGGRTGARSSRSPVKVKVPAVNSSTRRGTTVKSRKSPPAKVRKSRGKGGGDG